MTFLLSYNTVASHSPLTRGQRLGKYNCRRWGIAVVVYRKECRGSASSSVCCQFHGLEVVEKIFKTAYYSKSGDSNLESLLYEWIEF